MDSDLDRLVAEKEASRLEAVRRDELRAADKAAGEAERERVRPALLAEIDQAVARLIQRAAELGVEAANWRQCWPGTYGWPLIDDISVQSDGTWLCVKWESVKGNHSWDEHGIARCTPANHPLASCPDPKTTHSTIINRVADHLVALNGAEELNEITTISRAYPPIEAFARRHRARIIPLGANATGEQVWKLSRTNLFKGPDLWRASIGPDGAPVIVPMVIARSS